MPTPKVKVSRTLAGSVIPKRYYGAVPQTVRHPADIAPPAPRAVATPVPAAPLMQLPAAAPAPAWTPPPAPAPAPLTPLPMAATPRQTPIEQPAAAEIEAPRYVPAEQFAGVAAPYNPPAYATSTEPAPQLQQLPSSYVPPHRTSPRDRFSVGIEGFYSNYEEGSIGMEESGPFGSLTGSYTHYFSPRWYGALDLRGSYGYADYSSSSGEISDITQWETENRLLAGYDFTYAGNSLKVYSGLGTRYFSDEAKGKVSSTGALAYDRRIFQLYLPIGATYEFSAYGIDFAPNLELDPIFWGNVSSRLGSIPGYYDVENRQTSGLGIRAELMMRQLNSAGSGWEFGPFLRYWDVPDSDTTTDPASNVWVEPENSRLQAGAALKYRF